MAADQYCLKWNNHQSTLLVQFETLLESDSLTDCTLSAEGKYLNVHKVLLSACSPYFSKLLGEHKDKHPIFFMKDVAFEELKGIVEYMYKGEVNVMQERLDSFLKTASSLQIKGLADQDGGKGDEREEDPGGGRGKRKQAPDLRGGGGYGDSSPMPEEPPRSPKRRRRPRPVSQDDSLPAHDQNHCDTTTAPPSSAAYQQDVVMPTPLVPVKKTEPVDNSMVHLKTEIPDDVPQVDVQDLTLDDDEDFNNEDITQPGTSFSETSQDFAQWQQQMATQSGADESFIAATQGINQSAGSQVTLIEVVDNQKGSSSFYVYESPCPSCKPQGSESALIRASSRKSDFREISDSDNEDFSLSTTHPQSDGSTRNNEIIELLDGNEEESFTSAKDSSKLRAKGLSHHEKPLSENRSGFHANGKIDKTKFFCLCGEGFMTRVLLAKHRVSTCGISFRCSLCHYVLISRRTLSRHLLALHKTYLLEKCKNKNPGKFTKDQDVCICGFYSKNQRELHSHRRLDCKEFIKCYLCTYTTKTQSDILSHVTRVHCFEFYSSFKSLKSTNDSERLNVSESNIITNNESGSLGPSSSLSPSIRPSTSFYDNSKQDGEHSSGSDETLYFDKVCENALPVSRFGSMPLKSMAISPSCNDRNSLNKTNITISPPKTPIKERLLGFAEHDNGTLSYKINFFRNHYFLK